MSASSEAPPGELRHLRRSELCVPNVQTGMSLSAQHLFSVPTSSLFSELENLKELRRRRGRKRTRMKRKRKRKKKEKKRQQAADRSLKIAQYLSSLDALTTTTMLPMIWFAEPASRSATDQCQAAGHNLIPAEILNRQQVNYCRPAAVLPLRLACGLLVLATEHQEDSTRVRGRVVFIYPPSIAAAAAAAADILERDRKTRQ